jgi:hypothetical protein
VTRYERKDFNAPDEVRTFARGRLEYISLRGTVLGRLVLEPGWRWSDSIGRLVDTAWCDAPHFQYHAAGRIRIVSADGEEFEAGPGEVTSLPPGHDAYVVGDDPVVIVDFFAATGEGRRA